MDLTNMKHAVVTCSQAMLNTVDENYKLYDMFAISQLLLTPN